MTYNELGFSVQNDFYLDLTEQPQKMILVGSTLSKKCKNHIYLDNSKTTKE